MGYSPQFVLVVTVLISAPVFASNPIYTYTDDSGTPTFTTDLESIPEKYRNQTVPLDAESTVSLDAPVQPPPAASLKVVTANGEYRMGDHDTRSDAVRLAIESAKRQALEQVATYLESVTEVKNMDVTREDIRTYTAGIVTVLNQKITTTLEGETVVIHADITAQVDPNEVVQAITALRENESAKTELAALRAETDQLHQQLDAANQALATAASSDQVQALNQQRQDLLNQLQANALVSQAWTDWVYVRPAIYPYPWLGVQQVNGLLLQARQLNPQNRHFHTLQQIVTVQGGAPSAMAPPAPSSIPPHASLLVPPPAPHQSTSLPHDGQVQGRNALPPPVHQASPSTLSPRFSAPLPPTLQQVHPPHLAQPSPPILRAPYSYVPQSAPQMRPQHFGGRGGHFGGGHRGR